MKCPNCKDKDLQKTMFHNIEVDYCPFCLGIWFERDELRKAKDDKDNDLQWLDIDLWENQSKFHVANSIRVCPRCSVPLYEVSYGDSDVKVDVCNMCKGIFLNRGEFREIIGYLRKQEKDQILYNYFNNIIEEAIEVFHGPEDFKKELLDFLAVLKLLDYKMATQHPIISKAILDLPK